MKGSQLLFDPAGDQNPDLNTLRPAIGNKAASLLLLADTGVAVPHWASLTTAFFAEWVAEIEAAFPYSQLVAEKIMPGEDRLRLDALLATLKFGGDQRAALQTIVSAIGESEHGYAVRSSCQNEDQSNYSFAGIYASKLGVSVDGLEPAVVSCFASYYSAEALSYSQKAEVERNEPSFSLIIQAQLACEVAGIGFSIHPVNNCYDIVYINSNLGLGESIAAGTGDLDSFEVDKNFCQLLKSSIGDKRHRTQLGESGGVESLEFPANANPSLSERQLALLVARVKKVEDLLGMPVEIEWGIVGSEVWLLQARPVTRWLPLPRQMRTAPGEQPVLYMDRSLSDGMTMNKPASPLGLDIIRGIELPLYERFLGAIDRDYAIRDSLLFHAGGRIYANLSVVLCLTTPEKLIAAMAPLNGQLSQILGGMDLSLYRREAKPAYLRYWKLSFLPRIAWRARTVIGKIRRGIRNPGELKVSYDKDIETFLKTLESIESLELPFVNYVERVQKELIDVLVNVFLPALLVVSNGAAKPLEKLFPEPDEEDRRLIDALKNGFSDNLVVGMGRRMQKIGRALVAGGLVSAEAAVRSMESGRLEPATRQDIESFLTEFGHRGPNEMDIAKPRYRDDLHATFAQMLVLSAGGETQEQASNPASARDAAYTTLLSRLKGSKARKLKNIYAIYEAFGALRDTPKHYLLMGLQKLRGRSLLQGRALVEQGRLDTVEQIFNLDMPALADTEANLRCVVERNRELYELQNSCVDEFPSLVDSRGYIPAHDHVPTTAPGVLKGTPVSPGIVRGRVRLLVDAKLKTVDSSDIVVAYVTDPGLTPCFFNAAGVVLEIGGALQHGAVVARELGIPCVSSVLGITRLLQEGDEIEIDGGSGTVRILNSVASACEEEVG